jgi:type IV pilus assembly protein PilV
MHLSAPQPANGSVRQRGFSIVEVMVAVIVICVGLLGIAKMQALALSNMNTSRQRSLAALEAASLASAMHSNRAYWAASSVPTTVTVGFNPTLITSTDATLASTANADIGSGTAGLTACVGTIAGGAKCTSPQALAAYDMANWANDLSQVLPNPIGTISCAYAAGTPTNCTINITWTETAVAMTQQAATQQATHQGAASAQLEKPYYFLYVEP